MAQVRFKMDDTGVVNRANRKLRITWCAEFPDEHDLELAAECVGDDPAHWDSSAGNGQDEGVLVPIAFEARRQLARGVGPVLERHTSQPPWW
jgi:hypothetical protein